MTPIRYALALACLLAAPIVARSSIGENLVQQWTLDEGINGWDNLAGKLWEQEDDCHPLPEQPNPGSLEMLADDYVSQCVGIIGDEYYYIQTYVKVMMIGEAFGLFGISVQWHSNSNCTAYIEGWPVIHPFAHYTGATDWYKMVVTGYAPLNAHSAKVVLGAQKTSGTAEEIRVRFDDVIVAPLHGMTTTTTTTTTTSTTTTSTTEDTTTTTDEPNAPGCADPIPPYDVTTTSDALFVLRSSVGVVLCGNCFCDIDGSGDKTASDALRTLRLAVGQSVAKICGACEA